MGTIAASDLNLREQIDRVSDMARLRLPTPYAAESTDRGET